MSMKLKICWQADIKNFLLVSLLILYAPYSGAGFFSSKVGQTFQTKGVAIIYRNGTFTVGIEKRNISIPTYIDVEENSSLNGLTHDDESGWTQCRVPLKSEFAITGMVERSLVFSCKPLTYYK